MNPTGVPGISPPEIIADPGCAEASALYEKLKRPDFNNPLAQLMVAAHKRDAKTHEPGCFVLSEDRKEDTGK